jgi:ankyrin repeat protein
MKNLVLTFLLCAAASAGFAGTNELKSQLQRGLLEEEVNRNFKAALEAYQRGLASYDADRALAATTLFRIAETHRKLGQTNEARAHYERLLREFADQTELTAVARKQTELAGAPPVQVAAPADPYQPATPEEAEELARLRIMARNSPDLLNAPMASESSPFKPKVPPLHHAAAKGHLSAVKFLLDSGARVNQPIGTRGATPLHTAVFFGRKTIAELLISRGADVNVMTDAAQIPGSGMQGTPLHMAAAQGFTAIAEMLLEKGADIEGGQAESTPLHEAVSTGRAEMVRLLLSRGANVNARYRASSAPTVANHPLGATPLHFAASNGFEDLINLLLENGAEVNAVSSTGATPLYFALSYGHAGASLVLLQNGPNPNLLVKEPFGPPRSPLHLLFQNFSANTPAGKAIFSLPASQVFEALLKQGADPNIPMTDGQTPLCMAIGRRFEESIISRLLEHNADANQACAERTPLAIAVQMNLPRSVKLLVEHGADPNRRIFPNLPAARPGDVRGPYSQLEMLPIIYAARIGAQEALEALIEAGAEINAKDGDAATALHQAVENRQLKTMEWLIANGADVNAKDVWGRTPLAYILSIPGHSHPGSAEQRIKTLLEKHGAISGNPAPPPPSVEAAPAAVPQRPALRQIPDRSLKFPAATPGATPNLPPPSSIPVPPPNGAPEEEGGPPPNS